MKNAQIHRFHNKVAGYVGTGETVYLTPKEARKIAKALNACARSCDKESFQESNFNTFRLEFEGTSR